MERSTGIEPVSSDWQTETLPLSYDRKLVEAWGIEPQTPILQGSRTDPQFAPIIVLQIQRFKERRHDKQKAPDFGLGLRSWNRTMIWSSDHLSPRRSTPRPGFGLQIMPAICGGDQFHDGSDLVGSRFGVNWDFVARHFPPTACQDGTPEIDRN